MKPLELVICNNFGVCAKGSSCSWGHPFKSSIKEYAFPCESSGLYSKIVTVFTEENKDWEE